MLKNLNIRALVAVAIIIVAFSVYGFYDLIFTNPVRVFDRMLANSLSTTSVSKVASNADESQESIEKIYIQSQPRHVVRTLNTMEQKFDGDAAVSNEKIGTLGADYFRYTSINTSQTNEQGELLDFSEVVNIWGKSDQNDPNSNGATNVIQETFGVIPIVNIPQPARGKILKQIQNNNVFVYSPDKVKRIKLNGRLVYEYEIKLTPFNYYVMIKTIGQAMGFKQFDKLEPNNYADSESVDIRIFVDVWSGQLVKLEYVDTNKSESYGSYGARSLVQVPKDTIPIYDLQSRLQMVR